MATYAELQSQIADDINRTDLNTQIQTAIKRAIKFYSRKRSYFNEMVATASTVADQEYYEDPTYNREMDTLSITVSGNKYLLKRRSFQEIESWSVTSTFTGVPTDWAQHRQQLRLYPIPDAVYTLTLSYQLDWADLSATSDTNAMTIEVPDLIEARARWWLLTRTIKDQQAAAEAKVEELQEWQAVEAETAKRIMTGRVRATDF